MDAKELLERYAAGERDFSGLSLHKIDLRRANLRRANLHEADLTQANLIRTDLAMTNLRGANLTQANLHGADLTQANLHGADLTEAYLHEADLTEANLIQVNLEWADLTEANLTEARLPHPGFVRLTDAEIARQILAESERGHFNNGEWHTCETTHCGWGWAVILNGESGLKLEKRLGIRAAGAILFPSFSRYVYANNVEALMTLRRIAAGT